jgi:hypothetical protein
MEYLIYHLRPFGARAKLTRSNSAELSTSTDRPDRSRQNSLRVSLHKITESDNLQVQNERVSYAEPDGLDKDMEEIPPARDNRNMFVAKNKQQQRRTEISPEETKFS